MLGFEVGAVQIELRLPLQIDFLPMNDKLKSLVLDFFQVSSQLYIFLTAPVVASNGILIFFQLLALGILLEAAWEMRRTKYYRVPDIGRQNELVKNGIFTYIRNPMYLAQLLFSGALLVSSFSFDRLLVYLILFINFVFKIHYEEVLLHRNFTDFAAYKKTSRRLLPFIY